MRIKMMMMIIRWDDNKMVMIIRWWWHEIMIIQRKIIFKKKLKKKNIRMAFKKNKPGEDEERIGKVEDNAGLNAIKFALELGAFALPLIAWFNEWFNKLFAFALAFIALFLEWFAFPDKEGGELAKIGLIGVLDVRR